MPKTPLYLWNPGCPCCDVNIEPYDYEVLKFDSTGTLVAAFKYEDNITSGVFDVQADANGQLYVSAGSGTPGANVDAVVASDWSSVSYSNKLAGNGHEFFWVDTDTASPSPGDPIVFSYGDHELGGGEVFSAMYSDLTIRWSDSRGGSMHEQAEFSAYQNTSYYLPSAGTAVALDNNGNELWLTSRTTETSLPLFSGCRATTTGVVIRALATSTYNLCHLSDSDGTLDWEISISSLYPGLLAVDWNSGDIYVAMYASLSLIPTGTERVKRYDSSGTFQNDIAVGDVGNRALWVDDNGKVYVLSADYSQWKRYSPSGTLELSVDIPHAVTHTTSPFTRPRRISVDVDGYVYVGGGTNTLPAGYESIDFIT